MKILLYSTLYTPSIGGMERVVELLARGFHELGHAVTVATETEARGPEASPWPVIRKPGRALLRSLAAANDGAVVACVTLRAFGAFLGTRARTVITHHTWYDAPGSVSLRGVAKRGIAAIFPGVAVSAAVNGMLFRSASVVPNPYDDVLFVRKPVERDGDLLFVGRLVSDKGADLLVRAAAILANEGRMPSVTVAGEGPERPRLEALATELGVAGYVEFVGARTGDELAELYRRHRTLVIPSRWEEPFGLVALEALACGCDVIAARGGGLPEALGGFGTLFEKGSAEAVAAAIRGRALPREPAAAESLSTFLSEHAPRRVAARYLELLRGGR